MPRTTDHGRRTNRGVTLVELLVVILIMLMITAITVPVIAPAMSNREVREAARMIDVFINGARTRALQAGHSYGVMIERMPGQPNGSVTLSYCEQPDPYSGDYASSKIRLMGNGGFGAWLGPGLPVVGGYTTSPPNVDPIFPMYDTAWLQNIAPGDLIVIGGTQYRIWAGEPFIDLNQDGYWDPGEPYADVDGSSISNPAGGYTPPNAYPNPGSVDPATGYFTTLPPTFTFGAAPSVTNGAYITYMYADPVLAAQYMNATGLTYFGPGDARNGKQPIWFGPGISPTGLPTAALVTQYDLMGNPLPFQPGGFPFTFIRRPVKTSAPSMQLPGGAVIDLGANYFDKQFGTVVPVPGSGLEVLVQNQNDAGWWSTFRANPLLDPALQSVIQQPSPISDPTSIMITFLPSGTVDRVYSWSEANDITAGASGSPVVNWSDWQGRIPASPIYLLIGRQELVDGDPALLPLIEQNKPPHKPIFNVQDPNALWVVINPRTGAVATTENVGSYNLEEAVPQNANWTGPNAMQMQIYWAANVYFARRLARSMLDMGGR